MIRIDNYIPFQYPGPVSRRKVFRLKMMWLFAATIGLGISLFSNCIHLQSFGLGLVFPGAGFLLHVTSSVTSALLHMGFLAASVILFFLAVFLWFWNGNILAPIAVWVTSAMLAGWMDHPELGPAFCTSATSARSLPIAPIATILLLATVTFAVQRLISLGLARQRDSLERRKSVISEVSVSSSPLERDGLTRQVRELSQDDVAALRFALDRALQPIDDWNGFHFSDQWQPAAPRYQVNTLGWALALANHNSLPSMRGYLQEAQLNLIEK